MKIILCFASLCYGALLTGCGAAKKPEAQVPPPDHAALVRQIEEVKSNPKMPTRFKEGTLMSLQEKLDKMPPN